MLDSPEIVRKPFLAFAGAALIPVFLVAYSPLFTFWCHYIEAHATEAQKQNGAYINGFYAFGVMINIVASFAAVLAVCCVASLLRGERGAFYSLFYGVPALGASLAVAALYGWEFVGTRLV